MTNAKPILTRRAVRGVLSTAVVVLSLASPPAGAAEGTAAVLRAADVVALAGRFRQYANDLPPAARLGMTKILAFEEGKHFVYIRGTGPAGQRRVVFCKPATFVIDDRPAGAKGGWRLACRQAPKVAGRGFSVGQGEAALTGQMLLPKAGDLKVGKDGAQGVQAPASDRFLHVLHVGPPKAAPKADLVAKDGTLKVTLKAGTQTFTVTFPADAGEAGTIAVKQADGKTALAERLLPAGIMPHGAKGVRMLQRWDGAYRGTRRAPWDTGWPAYELAAAIESGALKPGRAVVLGCGSGTNAVFLAKKGFDVTAIDVAPTALSMARAKADKAKVKVRWLLADVLAPPPLEAFDVIFDRGCYHGVRRVSATGYAKTVQTLSKPGAHMLILAGNANEPRHYGPPRVDETDLVKDFAAQWDFVWLKETRMGATDPKAKTGPWAWSVLLRRKTPKK